MDNREKDLFKEAQKAAQTGIIGEHFKEYTVSSCFSEQNIIIASCSNVFCNVHDNILHFLSLVPEDKIYIEFMRDLTEKNFEFSTDSYMDFIKSGIKEKLVRTVWDKSQKECIDLIKTRCITLKKKYSKNINIVKFLDCFDGERFNTQYLKLTYSHKT
jgi:hypothetical protein